MTTGTDAPRRILLVDEPDVTDSVATSLEHQLDDVTAVTAATPTEALAQIGAERVDCVVSEYVTRGRDGLELFDAVRDVDETVPFVLFTGTGDEAVASEAITAGVTDYVRKGADTVQYERLTNCVERVIDGRNEVERSSARYEVVLATIDDPVCTVAADGTITGVNAALTDLLGYVEGALRGRTVDFLFADDAPPELHDGSTAASTADGGTATIRDDVTVRAADGAEITCELRTRDATGGSTTGARICVFGDVSDRIAAEREVRATNEKITAIHDFAHEVASCDSVETVFDRTVDVAEEILEFDRCNVGHRRGNEIVPIARSSNVDPDDVRTFEVGEGVTGRTVAEQETIVVNEIRSVAAEPVSGEVRSAISVPIGEHGTFQATSRRPHDFDETDVEFADLVASHAREAVERIETESRLRAERDRLASLFENVLQPTVRVRVDDGPAIDAVNDAYEETFGLTAREHSPERVKEKLVPEDEELIDPADVFDSTEPNSYEARRQTTDGVRDFLVTTIPVEGVEDELLYAVYTDIGEQKRIERTLRRLHEATREMLRADDAEGIAEVAARAAIDTIGFPAGAIRLFDSESETLDRTAASSKTAGLLPTGRTPVGPGDSLVWQSYDRGDVLRVDDVRDRETSLSYEPLRSLLLVPLGERGLMPLGAPEAGYFDESDEYLARVLAANVEVALDRADRTQQLRDRDARLEREIDRLEKFASVVSHDLRNPLSIAAGHLDLLEDAITGADAVESADAADHFDRVAEAHDRMERLIEDLLALAREGETVDETTDVPLRQTATNAWHTVSTGAAEIELREPNGTVEADEERLRTLLENLFRNAVEHAGDDVTVSIGTLEGGAGFAVADDGPGLDMSAEDALTYGVSSQSDGTGFGLAIVREIAEAHGWELAVEQSASGGVRFEFYTGGR